MIKHKGNQEYEGLSTDTKPLASDTAVNATFAETDTGKQYVNTGVEWVLQEMTRYLRCKVLISGSQWQVIDQHGKLQSSSTVDAQAAVQPVLDAMSAGTALELNYDGHAMTVNNPTIIPGSTPNTPKRVIIKGTYHPARMTTGGLSSCFLPSTTFPTNRYIFETDCPIGSSNTCFLTMEGITASNQNFTTRDVGFLKYEVDTTDRRCLQIKDIWGQYMWRGIHLIGGVWWGIVENTTFMDANATFVGDADIILETGGHTTGGNPTPKYNHISKHFSNHVGGKVDYFVHIINGNYNEFDYFVSDSLVVGVAGIALEQNTESSNIVAGNVFFNPHILDVSQIPTPDTRQAGIYLNGQYVLDNSFYSARVNRIINNVKISNNAARNYVQHAAYWGSEFTLNDTGAGISNTVELIGGSRTGATESAATITGGTSRIIDKRRGAENGGTIFLSGTGAATAFNIPHGLLQIPAWAFVGAGSSAIRAIPFSYTYDSTNISVTFSTAPASGSSNITLRWRAGIYA